MNISADRRAVEVSRFAMRICISTFSASETKPCITCFKVSNLQITGPNELSVDITLTHPYPGLLKYTGFDVRGIFISAADYTFPSSGRTIALGDTVPRMLNPDGFTSLFNPTEFPPTTPPALGYIAGKHATGGDLSATLNPFVAYRKDAPRRMFEAGGSETKTVTIHAPAGALHFGYAVDACWAPVNKVVDPIKDFPELANCLEAYAISVDAGSGVTAEIGGEEPIEVKVYDHQGQDTIAAVMMEAPDLFNGELPLSFSTVMPDEACLFTAMLPNNLGSPVGDYPMLVRAIDKAKDPNLGAVDAWQLSQVSVVPAHGWARTWGGPLQDIGDGVVVDKWGHIYVTGEFQGTANFDPGSGQDYHSTGGGSGAFLSKFDPEGNFEWARTWGAVSTIGSDECRSVAVDGSGAYMLSGNSMAMSILIPDRARKFILQGVTKTVSSVSSIQTVTSSGQEPGEDQGQI